MLLEQYYAGDEAWSRFYQLSINNPLSREAFNEKAFPVYTTLSADGQELLQVAMAYYGIARTTRWLGIPQPVLDGKTPEECIVASREIHVRNRMREYLMRLPA